MPSMKGGKQMNSMPPREAAGTAVNRGGGGMSKMSGGKGGGMKGGGMKGGMRRGKRGY